jgi:hypothetical protein
VSAESVAIERRAACPEDFDDRYREPRRPVILSGAVRDWPAMRWTPDWFKSRYGDVETSATVQLPETGVVYLRLDQAHRRLVKIRDFVGLMQDGACCYVDQSDLRQFPGLVEDCATATILAAGYRLVNLWIGARTRSGLHYDPLDNFFVQIYGEKVVMLAAPEDRARLYPFPDNIAKSRIDPEMPDVARYPRVKGVRFFIGTVAPGDLLYIPRGWWHFLRATTESISLNFWHEPALTLAGEFAAIGALGPAFWARVSRDFLWHGLLRRPYQRRLYSPPPTGKLLYDLCAMRLSGKPLP